MIVIICGARDWTDHEAIRKVVWDLPIGSTVIEGEASGADRIARVFAENRGLLVIKCPAQWGLYGRAAGPVRNKQMLTFHPDKVIAFHHNLEESKGTADMIKQARRAGVEVEVYG